MIEHHVAIVTLSERQIFGPMLSLVRPTVDRHLRALWVERVSGEAIDRVLTGPDTPDAETLLRLLRKASRLGEGEALLEVLERSPLYGHPALAGSAEHARARRAADMKFVPTLHDVIDGLNFSAGLALLSTMRMAQSTGDGGAEQSARFRFGVMAGVGR
ncbi:hypothetical protein ACFFGH_15975 [Lysobacter korlensis]|uniref:Uncharacterized protein n=1 Tax=Lysobacter korlensis TaxID=553636 RepID=A0ABV6RTV3_9GAMM